MDFQDLVDLIKENNKGDAQETLKDLLNIYRIQFENPNALDEVINSLAKDNDLCPMCGTELEKEKYSDLREYLGRECEEKMYNHYCPKCQEYIE